MAADTTYQPKVYKEHGGNKLVISTEDSTPGVIDISGGNDVILMTKNGSPTNGTSGTGAGLAGVGSLVIDRVLAVIYTNRGTKASPTWAVVGSAGA